MNIESIIFFYYSQVMCFDPVSVSVASTLAVSETEFNLQCLKKDAVG